MLPNTLPPDSTLSLHRWRVMEAVWPEDIRTRHVCAQDANNTVGVSTSSIQAFDPVAMTVKTRSGKTYILVGQPGNSNDLGEIAWRHWRSENNIVAEQDMTSEYLKTDPAPAKADPAPMNADPAPTITFKRLGFRYGDAAVG
ncbi:MAG: hypothetical protein HZB47_10150 [Nitrosomonadales bacterium]|nr:hypothetical protein [Nitrosomonadales bacterium]